ncbi:glycosyltransferase family 2 protein [Sphingomonas flavescens]|uniref:glycosyltransferase family 2 protein n=1 Tax=Sphingomonas flavescens TaxID=3132797 RepID=UPI002803E070|nr:glycosyltransferase family 2 protein [Sphingomonas limnosediminicola]
MPRVSILMPVFNAGVYLPDALESIRGQSFKDFELVIVNDGSTDGSSEILRAFAQQDPRTRLIERTNRGLIETRNELLSEASGDLIAWMDADDLSHPDRLQKQVGAFEVDTSLVCVGTNVERIDPDGHSLGIEHYPAEDSAIRSDQAAGNGLRFASTMQKRSVALDTGGFRHPFRMGEDLDFLLRVAERGRVSNLTEILYVYRQHLLNTCTAYGQNWPEICRIILQLAEERREQGSDRLQLGEEVTLPPVQSGDERKLLPYVLLTWARGAFEAGDRRRALRYALASLKMAPGRIESWREFAKLVLGR